MLRANRMACFIELELWPFKVLHCGRNTNLHFARVTLPWPDDLQIRNWPVFRGDIPHVWK